MTDIELEQLTANLCTKSVADIGSLASDAFVGHGMRDDGDSMVVLHAIVVQLLRELAPLRALREACEEMTRVSPLRIRVGVAENRRTAERRLAYIAAALAACDEAMKEGGLG